MTGNGSGYSRTVQANNIAPTTSDNPPKTLIFLPEPPLDPESATVIPVSPLVGPAPLDEPVADAVGDPVAVADGSNDVDPGGGGLGSDRSSGCV